MQTARIRPVILFALALAACGPGVHDLSLGSAPLLTIRGSVDSGALKPTDPANPLLAALVWADIPDVNPLCLEHGSDPRLEGVCPDPYAVFLGDLESSAPLALGADGTFSLELPRLPDAEVAVGDTSARIAYGTLLIVEDLNRNGYAEIERPPTGRQRLPDDPQPDRILAASFADLRRPQQRLVFREGGFVEGSRFYPAPECPAPPPGFSVLRTQGMGVEGGCTVEGPEAPLALEPIGERESAAMACSRTSGRNRRIDIEEPEPDDDPVEDRENRPADAPPLPPITTFCLTPEIYVEVRELACPDAEVFILKGCNRDPFCEEPDWDYTEQKPEWWRC